jgi:hypothetical protein
VQYWKTAILAMRMGVYVRLRSFLASSGAILVDANIGYQYNARLVTSESTAPPVLRIDAVEPP